MLSIEEIKQLIELIDSSNVDELELEVKDTKLKLKKNTGTITSEPLVSQVQAAPQVQPAQPVVNTSEVSHEAENLEVITSPMVGTFYASRTPEDPPFTSPGSKVTKDSVICIIEAMKLFNDITADMDGEIAEVLVTNGELVEFGQPLFKVRKS